MIIFDQLRLSDDGRKIYISAHVNNAEYFENVYLDSITIMTADKVSETDPNIPTSEYIYKKEFSDDVKEADLVLEASDFIKVWENDVNAMRFNQADMSRTLFFVYAKAKGVPSPDTPCSLDESTVVGVIFNLKLLYQKMMDYTKELLKDCTVPRKFIDFILLWNAFKIAIKTGHYVAAIKYFNMLFDNVDTSGTAKGCCCHG